MIKTNEILKKYNFSIQKKYGQNFLVDQNILEGIVDAADICGKDIVLEIGPGLGALTQLLCERAKHVIAVEIDRMLIPILQDTLQAYDNYTLVNQDILKTEIAKLVHAVLNQDQVQQAEPAKEETTPVSQDPKHCELSDSVSSEIRIKVVANLPYYITTPIVMALLEKNGSTRVDSDVNCAVNEVFIDSITVMVQKEVAERMREGVGTKAYGALSLAVQYYSKPEIVLHVSKNCFLPRPDVDSAVIRLQIYAPEDRPVKVADTDAMFRIIRAAFNQRRKTLVNALSNAANLSWSKEQIRDALIHLGKPEAIRGEALTLEEFAALTERLMCP